MRSIYLFLGVVLVAALWSTVAAGKSECTCSGQCGTFKCDPNKTRKCDCKNCRCMLYSDRNKDCTCSGKCGTFSCDPDKTKGCDCVNCRCIEYSRPEANSGRRDEF